MARQFDVTLLSIHLITLLKAFSLRSSPTSLGIYNLDGKASQEVRNQLLGGKYCVVSTKDLHIVIMPQGKCLCGKFTRTRYIQEIQTDPRY